MSLLFTFHPGGDTGRDSWFCHRTGWQIWGSGWLNGTVKDIAHRLDAYIQEHPFDSGDSDCETVLDQLYQAYAESHESDSAEIGEGFKNLEEFLHTLPLDDNNTVFNICCRLCGAYESKAFVDGQQYGVHLTLELL